MPCCYVDERAADLRTFFPPSPSRFRIGNLRYIRNLKPWPLQRVMTEKYGWSEADAASLCEFLLPMLRIDHRVRAHAREMVDHPWLEVSAEELDKVEW